MSNDIANLVCRNLDNRLHGLSIKYGIDYTRYCDDISFSGFCIPESFKKIVKKIISQSGFKLNSEKESLAGKHQEQIVTGISVNQKSFVCQVELDVYGEKSNIFLKNMSRRDYLKI